MTVFLLEICVLYLFSTQLELQSLKFLHEALLSLLELIKLIIQLSPDISVCYFDLLSFLGDDVTGHALHLIHLFLMILDTFLKLKLQPISQSFKALQLSLEQFVLLLKHY